MDYHEINKKLHEFSQLISDWYYLSESDKKKRRELNSKISKLMISEDSNDRYDLEIHYTPSMDICVDGVDKLKILCPICGGTLIDIEKDEDSITWDIGGGYGHAHINLPHYDDKNKVIKCPICKEFEIVLTLGSYGG